MVKSPLTTRIICCAGGAMNGRCRDLTSLFLYPVKASFFLLPKRRAVGLNKETGEVEELEELAVAAFVAPGYTISGHPVYVTEENAPTLPLFAYGALGNYRR